MNTNNTLKELIRAGNWVCTNRVLIKHYNLETAAIVGHLCTLQHYSNNTWFTVNLKEINEELNIAVSNARNCLKQLRVDGFLETQRHGMPSKVFYRVDVTALLKFIDENKGIIKRNQFNKNTIEVSSNDEQETPLLMRKRERTTTPKSTKETTPQPLSKIDGNTIIYKENKKEIYIHKSLFNLQLNEVLVWWNNQPNVSKHSIDPESKTYQKILTSFTNLTNGRPLICKKDNNPHITLTRFINNNDISPVILYKRWSINEIIHTLKETLKETTTIKPKLLPLLWNPFAGANGYSSFYSVAACLYNSPEAKEITTTLYNSLDKTPPAYAAKVIDGFLTKTKYPPTELLYVAKEVAAIKHDQYCPVITCVNDFILKYDRLTAYIEKTKRVTTAPNSTGYINTNKSKYKEAIVM